MSEWVRNPEDRFSHVVAHFMYMFFDVMFQDTIPLASIEDPTYSITPTRICPSGRVLINNLCGKSFRLIH